MGFKSDRKGTSVIEISASGDNTIVAAPTTGHLEIDTVVFVTAGSVNVRLKDGASTNKSGAMTFGTNGTFAYDRASTENAAIECADGNAFVINLSAAVGVNGICAWRVVGEN